MLKKIAYILVPLIIILGFVSFKYYKNIYGGNITKDTFIYIPTNATFEDVKTAIQPYVKNKESFEWVANKKNYLNKIKAGKYKLQKGANNNDVVNLLRSGNQTPIKLAFNNQNSLENLAGRIAAQIEADSLEILTAIQDPNFLKSTKFNKKTALGMYIPNSYEFYWNTNAVEFRTKMLKEYNRFWNTNRLEKAKKLNLSEDEVITLAAIVQKETSKIKERPMVARLYLNRLQNNWPLQADPTIIFALKEKYGQDKVVKRVLLKDLEIDSKYNTYKNIGLPPGPIAMPDISSIDAVLNPANHDYYFMCASVTNIGSHEFAKTLSQHNRNALKYQRWVNQQGILR